MFEAVDAMNVSTLLTILPGVVEEARDAEGLTPFHHLLLRADLYDNEEVEHMIDALLGMGCDPTVETPAVSGV